MTRRHRDALRSTCETSAPAVANGLTSNLPMGDGKGLGGLDFNHRPENRQSGS